MLCELSTNHLLIIIWECSPKKRMRSAFKHNAIHKFNNVINWHINVPYRPKKDNVKKLCTIPKPNRIKEKTKKLSLNGLDSTNILAGIKEQIKLSTFTKSDNNIGIPTK